MKYARDYKIKNSKRTEKGVFADIDKLKRILTEHYSEYECTISSSWTFNSATVMCKVDTGSDVSIRPRLICRLYDDETVEILLPSSSVLYEKVHALFSYKLRSTRIV